MSNHAHVLATHRTTPANGRMPDGSQPPIEDAGAPVVAAGLVAAGVLSQIAYPLLNGQALRIATVLSVLLLAAATVLHARAVWGLRAAGTLLLVAGGLGLVAETVGVHTGVPFGDYQYAGTLGPRLAGVPIVVPLAWTMLAYPCLLLGRRLAARPERELGRRALVTALTGGLGLAGWDLFLDPQMVAQGNWSWAHPSPALPGVPGVPLTNYAGWLLVSVLMIAALDRALPASEPAVELTPAAVLAWTWLGSAVGNLVFFGRPWVALYGGLVMGAVVLPYLWALYLRSHENTCQNTDQNQGAAQ
jgi:putative membrane protein